MSGMIMIAGMFKQICEEIVSLLPDCILGMDTLPDWGNFPPSSIVKRKAYKFALPAILIEYRNQ